MRHFANFIPDVEVFGKESGELLVLSWGGVYGSVKSAVKKSQEIGLSVSHVHLKYINPLGDITHDTIVLVSDTIPINIGFIASYINKTYGDKVDITLFKYPDDIINEIKSNPPDVIGLSNYSWTSNLSEFLASLAKKCNPNVVTFQGGTNFPHDDETQKTFLALCWYQCLTHPVRTGGGRFFYF